MEAYSTYIWVAKYLKMYNSYLALIIPGLVSFYIIVIQAREQIQESYRSCNW